MAKDTDKKRDWFLIIVVGFGGFLVVATLIAYVVMRFLFTPYAVAELADGMATAPSVLTRDKLVEHRGTIGDQELSGVFQLSFQDVARFQSSDQFLLCPEGENCQIDKHNPDDTRQCDQVVMSPNQDQFELCLDTQTNRATFSIKFH